MALFVYRRHNSNGARLLAEALGGRRIRNIGNLLNRRPGNPDILVCWGEQCDRRDLKVLNGAPLRTKFEDAKLLQRAGVNTVEVSETRPQQRLHDEVIVNVPRLGGYTRTQAQELLTIIQRGLATPVVPREEWLPRRFNHVGGNDLLNPPTVEQVDYFSKKLDLQEEYRLHIFNGKSIRAGVKRQREGATHHPWIRSYDGGWNICYNEFKSKKAMREISAAAVQALGLTFGAVDLGKKQDGSYVVLEVNRAAGMDADGGTLTAYVNAIKQYQEGV